MKIQKISQPQNTSFGSIPLFRATLFQKQLFKKAEPIEAFVSVIEKSDWNKKALDSRRWFFSTFADYIIEDAKKDLLKIYSFLMVETPSLKPTKQVRAISQHFFGTDKLILKYLQSKSETSLFSETKGAGSLIAYALSKIAAQKKLSEIFLEFAHGSSGFYKKIGFHKTSKTNFVLPSSDFKSFQTNMENKYNIFPV